MASYHVDVLHCDFCLTTEDLVATYYVDPFALPPGYVLPDRGYLDDGQWAACSVCHRLMQTDDRKKLFARSLRGQVISLGPSDDQRVAVYTRRMMDAFFEHYHGRWAEGV